MAPSRKDTVAVVCPKCGHTQQEPRSGYSTVCKKCRGHFRLQEALHPSAKPTAAAIEQRRIKCFQCGTDLDAPKAAESTMCKRCSAHVDLADHNIAQTVSKNFRTHGRLVIEPKGYLLNTESLVHQAVVKGRVIGKLQTTGDLEIHTGASIKGKLLPGRLVIPQGHRFGWPEAIQGGGAEIGGELDADLCCTGTVVLKATARLFGNIEAGALVVEEGAVFVGSAHVGKARGAAAPVEPAIEIN